MYYATLEKANGEIETVNGILKWDVFGGYLYLNGSDFEMFLSSSHYAFINIQEGEL